MADREFTNINGIKVCDQIARNSIPTKTSQLTNDSDYVTTTQVNQAIDNAQLGGGEVDLSGYVTKETGNANQITFSDGQTFQAKLDAGTLKGDKGDPGIQGEQGPQGLQGEQGIQGPKGDSGADNINDTTASATTTYSSNKIESIKEDLSSQIRAIGGSGGSSGGGTVSFRDIETNEIFTVSNSSGGSDNPTTYGDIVLSKTSIDITGSGTDTFTVKLSQSPTDNQIVNISTDNANVTIDIASLTFTPDNYNTEQTITITVVEDDNTQDDTCTITLSSTNVSNKTIIVNMHENTIVEEGSYPTDSLVALLSAKHSTGTIFKDITSNGCDIPLTTTSSDLWANNTLNLNKDTEGKMAQEKSDLLCSGEEWTIAMRFKIKNSIGGAFGNYLYGGVQLIDNVQGKISGYSQTVDNKYEDCISNTVLDRDVYYTVILTRSKSSGKKCIYINGELDRQVNISGGIRTGLTSMPFSIGYNVTYKPYGEIKAIAFYDKCLSNAEMTELNTYLGGL